MKRQLATPREPNDPAAGLGHGEVPPRGRPWRWDLIVVLLAGLVLAAVAIGRAGSRNARVIALLERMTSTNPGERQEARTALMRAGKDAVPVLVRVVRSGKSTWHSMILPWIESTPGLAQRRTRQIRLERAAVEMLQRIGLDAAPEIVPLLAEDRHGGRETAIALFRNYGPDVLPLLREAAKARGSRIRTGAMLALGRFSAAELTDLAPLVQTRADPDPAVRAAAIASLGQMADQFDRVLPELIAALADPAEGVRIEAIRALRVFGPQAAGAVEALREALSKENGELGGEIATTLACMGPRAADAGEELLAAMRQEDPACCRLAAAALVQLGVHAEAAMVRLTNFLNGRGLVSRAQTAEILGNLGTRATPAVPALLGLLENSDSRDDRAALLALREIRPEAIPERYQRRRPDRPPGEVSARSTAEANR